MGAVCSHPGSLWLLRRSLSCQRITLHKNLFCSYVLNSALTIIYLVAVVNNPEVVSRNPVSSASAQPGWGPPGAWRLQRCTTSSRRFKFSLSDFRQGRVVSLELRLG